MPRPFFMYDPDEIEIIPDEQVKKCPVCKDWTLFRYDHCPNCGFDISDVDGIDPDEFFHPELYE